MQYHWQLPDWPNFTFNVEEIHPLILEFAQEIGEANGIVQSLPNELQLEVILQMMLAEAINTSEIEGEYLSREDVMSSIRNNLGLNEKPVHIKDRRALGIAKLMVQVRKSYKEPMSVAALKEWHQLLMEGAKNIHTGDWRKGNAPMQVVSGAHGRETIHYEAPASANVPAQMDAFIKWFQNPGFEIKGNIAVALLKSAISHLYFESIHPFEDGNGRIGRAIAEKALSQVLERPVILSISKAIEKNRKEYYAALKKAQRTLVITDWVKYFVGVIVAAQQDTKATARFTLNKARFFNKFNDQLNDRQLKAVNKMFGEGTDGFEGGMTAKKYISITKASKATATRDLQYLHELGVLVREGAGRTVRYHLGIA